MDAKRAADAADRFPTRDGVLRYLIDHDVVPAAGPATDVLRAISALPVEDLRVQLLADRLGVGRRTLVRRLRSSGLPAPHAWIVLARTLHAHRVILRGGTLKEAAMTAGFPDQFTMSNAIHRISRFRPSEMDSVRWQQLVEVWIARQRARGTLSFGC